MRTLLLRSLMAALLAGCAREPMREMPISASEMGASFAYGEVGPQNAHYRQGTDPRSGAVIQQMAMSSPDEAAHFAVVTLVGDYVFTPAAFRRRLTPLLPSGQAVEWGEASRTSGMQPAKFAIFTLPAGSLQCVGMERRFKNHREASSVYSQGLAIGYYCRPGQPFSLDEAEAVAAALRTSG